MRRSTYARSSAVLTVTHERILRRNHEQAVLVRVPARDELVLLVEGLDAGGGDHRAVAQAGHEDDEAVRPDAHHGRQVGDLEEPRVARPTLARIRDRHLVDAAGHRGRGSRRGRGAGSTARPAAPPRRCASCAARARGRARSASRSASGTTLLAWTSWIVTSTAGTLTPSISSSGRAAVDSVRPRGAIRTSGSSGGIGRVAHHVLGESQALDGPEPLPHLGCRARGAAGSGRAGSGACRGPRRRGRQRPASTATNDAASWSARWWEKRSSIRCPRSRPRIRTSVTRSVVGQVRAYRRSG